MRKYARPSRPSVAIDQKIGHNKNAARRQVTFQRDPSKYSKTLPVLFQLQLHLQVLRHKTHENTEMKMESFTRPSICYPQNTGKTF